MHSCTKKLFALKGANVSWLTMASFSVVSFIFVFFTFTLGCSTVFATSLDVTGWLPAADVNVSHPAPRWLGDDAIMGRLACPAVLRLEGDHMKNAPLLLKQPPLVEHSGSGETWIFNLRPGLRWWSGGAVDGEAIAAWLRENLKDIVQDRLGITIPANVVITASGPLGARVEWPSKPKFGPYVLSGVSLLRMTAGTWDCVGLYSLTPSPGGFDLTLSKGYTAKYSKIRVRTSGDSPSGADHSLSFSMASRATKATSTKIDTSACSSRIDIPLMTAIVWNPATPMASTAILRQALTMATPRGELLRTAAGDIGSLVSAPIIRSHPGYNTKTLVRSYSLDTAGKIFDQAGFKQPHIGLPRGKESDKPSLLRVGRLSGKQDLIEKIISDSMASLGIEVRFEDKTTAGAVFDAALVSTFIPWTSEDLRSLAHSDATKSHAGQKADFPFSAAGDKSLDELLDAYSLSLTQTAPDFSLLRKVHEKWFEIEPWTILMAHQFCVSGQGMKVPSKINTLDPDWFRRLAVE